MARGGVAGGLAGGMMKLVGVMGGAGGNRIETRQWIVGV